MKHYPMAVGGAFGHAPVRSVFEGETRVYTPGFGTTRRRAGDMEAERREQLAKDQVALAMWRERELNPDDYEPEVSPCPECREPIVFETTFSGTMSEWCACGWEKLGKSFEPESRPQGGAFGDRRPLKRRRRFWSEDRASSVSVQDRGPSEWPVDVLTPGVGIKKGNPRGILSGKLRISASFEDAVRAMFGLRFEQGTGNDDGQMPLACSDEVAAVLFLERQRGWAADSEATCPHCNAAGQSRRMRARDGSRSARFLWRCYECKKQFTVKVGTVMQASPIPAHHWCLAFFLAVSLDKGVSATQVGRETGLSYKPAMHLMRRIRRACAA